MKFSTKTTYGLRAMIELARHEKQGSLALKKIADKENISLKYLERLFAQLKKAGLVKSEMGAGGGYTLAKNSKEIIIFDIIKALEGKMTPFYCLDENGKIYCQAKCKCGATKVLVKVQEAVNQTLKSMTLRELV